MKLAVGSSSEGSQDKIIEKAYSVLSSCPSFTLMKSMPITSTVQLEGLQYTQNLECFSYRDKWVISLFASAIIAVRPQTPLAVGESCANKNDTAKLVASSIHVGQFCLIT